MQKSPNSLLPFFSLHSVNIMFACVVMSLTLSLFPIALLSPFVFVMSVAVFHSSTPALKAVVPSRSLSLYLMLCPSSSLLCFACDIMALFSLLSQYSPCHLSVASVLCEGYLTAISGFIFALSFGLSQRCCPHVIICDQGGDLFSLTAS